MLFIVQHFCVSSRNSERLYFVIQKICVTGPEILDQVYFIISNPTEDILCLFP
jgi:hypothetical protein